MTKTNKSSSMIKWAINFIIPLIIWMIPTTEAFTADIRTFFVISIFAIILIATENLPMFTIAVAIPFLYIVGLNQDPSLVFKAWSLEVPWMILGGFILTIALRKSGILKRLSYHIIMLFGGTVRGILYGSLLIGTITAAVVADPTAKAVLLGALILGICDALDIEKGSKNSTVIGLALLSATMGPTFIFMTAPGFMSVAGIISTAGYYTPSYTEYLYHMAIPQLIFCILNVVLIDIMFKTEKISKSKDFFKAELEKLGKVTTNELKVSLVSIGLIIMLVSGSIHGISTGWIFLLVAVVVMLPGINLVTAEDSKTINFTFMMFVVACLTIGVVSGPLGVGKFISDMVYPYIANSETQMFAGVWSLGVISNFILTPLAAYSTFTLPVLEMTAQAGMEHMPVIYTFVHSLEQVIFPYEYAPVLLIFGYGLMSFKDFVKYNAVKMVLSIICVFVLYIPYWRLIGLF